MTTKVGGLRQTMQGTDSHLYAAVLALGRLAGWMLMSNSQTMLAWGSDRYADGVRRGGGELEKKKLKKEDDNGKKTR